MDIVKREYHRLWKDDISRKNFSFVFRLNTLMEEFCEEKNNVQICRERKIKDTQYYKWRETFLENAANIFDNPKGSKYQGLEDRITELERMIGQLTMENEILKKNSWLGASYRKNGS